MSNFYDTPCATCGEGIQRTGKRGRPPLTHVTCKNVTATAPAVQKNPTTKSQAVSPDKEADFSEVNEQTDDELSAINEFLSATPVKTRSALIELRENQYGIRVRELKVGHKLYLRNGNKYVTLTNVSVDPISPEHVKLAWKGDSIRVIRDGMCYIYPEGKTVED